MRQLTALFLTLFAFLSCADHRTGAILSSADSLMEKGVDSARHALLLLDSVERECGGMGRSLQMRLQLLRAKAMNKGYVDFTTDSIMKEVVEYYDSHGSENDRMLAHYLLGCVYRDLDMPFETIEALKTAEELADTLAADCNFSLLGSVYGQLGLKYMDVKMHEDAIVAWRKASSMFIRASDPLMALRSEFYEASLYEMTGQSGKAVSMKEELYHDFMSLKDTADAAMSLCSTIFKLVEDSNLTKAKAYMDKYAVSAGLADKDGNVPADYCIFLKTKGDYFLKSGDPDSAIMEYRKFLFSSTDNDMTCSAYQCLAKSYKQKGMTDSVAHYAMKALSESDSLLLEMEKTSSIRLKKLSDFDEIKLTAARMKSEKKQTLIVASFVVIVIMMSSVTLFMYIRQRHLARMNSLMLKEKQEREALERFQLYESDIYVKIKGKSKRGIALSDNEKLELKEYFDKKNPNFHIVLNTNCSLSDKEFLVCILTRMGFSPSDIQNLIGISSAYASTIRKRLAQKVFKESLSPKQFDERIKNIPIFMG